MDITYRTLDVRNPREKELLVAVDKEAHAAFPNDQFDEEDWLNFTHLFEFIGVYWKNELVGTIHLGKDMHWVEGDMPTPLGGCLYLAGLQFFKRFQCRGFGTIALNHIVDVAKEERFNFIEANCRRSNVVMPRLLKSNGFREFGILSNFSEEPEEDMLIFRYEFR